MNQSTEQVCEQFGAAWRMGKPFSIETALQLGDEELRDSLFLELLTLEVALRQAAGQRPSVSEYSARFPNREHLINSVLVSAGAISSSEEVTVDLRTVELEVKTDPSDGVQSNNIRATTESSNAKSIGRYTVIGKIGRGGQADVFRAVHPNLPVEVAIKLMHSSLPQKAREALREEAHVLCDLDHPNIARIRDFDFDEGRPFMVLDFIRGRSLGEVAASQPYGPNEAARVVAQIARAIGFAHAHGVIHRDLKPGNIVIDVSGNPKIIDFGMSRVRSGITNETQKEADEISGTFAYMSPEQAEGISARTDHRVDIFALGAILYRLLVGKAPYDLPSIDSMLTVVRQGEWDTESLDQIKAPDELKAICRQAMSSDPAERFGQAEAMAAALESCFDCESGPKRDSVGGDHDLRPSASQSQKRTFTFSAVGWGIGISLTISVCMLFIIARAPVWNSVHLDSLALEPNETVHSIIAGPENEPASVEMDGISTSREEGLIESFEVIHIGNSNGVATFTGSLFEHRSPRNDDDIQVQVEFREPVYCFLLALNPDGVKQLCFPLDPATVQADPVRQIRYPEEEDAAFGLTDGLGQQAFVLYTSRFPLPAFEDWTSELVSMPWPNPSVGGNWEYRNGDLNPIGIPLREEPTNRGQVRKTKTANLLKQLCDRLRQINTSDVHAVTFEVISDH